MKMRITFAPEGAPPESWEFDPDTADNLESEALEIVGDTTWGSYTEWLAAISRGNMRAIRALLWVLQRRADPDLDFNMVRFRLNEISTDVVDETQPEGKGGNGDSDTGSPQPDSVSAV